MFKTKKQPLQNGKAPLQNAYPSLAATAHQLPLKIFGVTSLMVFSIPQNKQTVKPSTENAPLEAFICLSNGCQTTMTI